MLKQYREHPETFSIDYQRKNKAHLSIEVEEQIRMELLRDKELVENEELPIHDYNYTALVDRLKNKGVRVSTTTIILRTIQ